MQTLMLKLISLFTICLFFLFPAYIRADTNCTGTITWDAPQYFIIPDTCTNNPNKPIPSEQQTELIYEVYTRVQGTLDWVLTTTTNTVIPYVGVCNSTIEVKVCAKFNDTAEEDICCTEVVTGTLTHAVPGCSTNLTVRSE